VGALGGHREPQAPVRELGARARRVARLRAAARMAGDDKRCMPSVRRSHVRDTAAHMVCLLCQAG